MKLIAKVNDGEGRQSRHFRSRAIGRLGTAVHLLQPRERVTMVLLVAMRISMGLCDLLLAAAMYILFILIQGGSPLARGWWTPQTVLSAALITVVLILVRIAIDLGSTAFVVRFTQALYADRVLRLTQGYGRMRWSQFVQRNRSAMLKHAMVTALDAAYSYQLFIEIISASIVVTIFGAALIYQSPMLAVSLGVIALLLYGLHRLALRDRLNTAAAEREVALRQLQKTLAETFASGREIRAYRNEGFFLERIRRQVATIATNNERLTTLPQAARVFAEQGVVLLFLAIVIVVEIHHSQLRQLPALLVFYFILSRRLLPMLSTLALTFGQLEGAYENLQTIDQELRDCKMLHASAPAVDPPAPNHVLELANVSFAFEDGTQVVRDVSLDISMGEIVILRGVSGSGKSSLLNLIAGVSHPDSGSIRVNRAAVTYVPQEIALLDDTVRNNLLFGLREIDDVELMRCLAAVNLAGFIESLPSGLDARVGDNGVLFSGGQRQRLGLARALVRHSSLLLLDEATSALDEENEQQVLRNIAAMKVAILMVTHRTHGREFADRTQRLEDGMLVGRGSAAAVYAT